MRRAVLILGMLCLLGCESTVSRDRVADTPEERNWTATRPAGQGDQLSDQAGGMLQEDARRTPAALNEGQRRRPDPIRREQRPPVDQPRLR
jgi:hypothetical protein